MNAPLQKLTTRSLVVVAITFCLTSLGTAQENRRLGTLPDLTQGVLLASFGVDEYGLRRYDGHKLLNTEAAELGTVKDLIVHPQSSSVRYVVVSSGGVLGGIGNSLRLIPVEAVRIGNRKNTLEVDILQSAWLQIPPISDEHYVSDRFEIAPAQHQAMVQRYGSVGRPVVVSSATASPVGLVGLMRASLLRGKNVRVGNQPVGEIENVIVDLTRGTAAALLDSSGEFTGTRGKYIFPLNRLVFDKPHQDPIGMTLARADFDRAQPLIFGTVGSAAPQTRTTDEFLTPTGRTSFATPVNQASDALAMSAREVQRALVNDPALVTERVQVTTVDGRIILTGAVRTEATRAQVINAAQRAVPGGIIENRITVENR